MDLDALLQHYFGCDDPDTLDEAAIEAGSQRVLMALAMEGDSGRRFALWALLQALDRAPEPAAVFKKDPVARKAAEDYARALGRMERD